LAARQLLRNGTRKPKGKPRGISKLRLLDPSIPNPLAPYIFKPGERHNPSGRSKAVRISDAVREELSQIIKQGDVDMTRAGVLASKLLDRAEKDSTELDRVVRYTEPELLRDAATAGPQQNIVIVDSFDDGSIVVKPSSGAKIGSNGNQPSGRQLGEGGGDGPTNGSAG
jgi:hypothetical protein